MLLVCELTVSMSLSLSFLLPPPLVAGRGVSFSDWLGRGLLALDLCLLVSSSYRAPLNNTTTLSRTRQEVRDVVWAVTWTSKIGWRVS